MRLACLFVAVTFFGCGSNSTMTSTDMTASVTVDMQVVSACGHPGDTGNSKHIGQYCVMPFGDCPGNLTCSSIENGTLPPNQQTFFCTVACTTAGPDPACGENTLCVCGKPGLCGCTPAVCV